MNKRFFLFLSIVFMHPCLQAQEALPKGSMNVCIGYGYNAFSRALTGIWSDEPGFKNRFIGPAHAKFEYMASDNFGIGLSANFINYKFSYNFSYSDNGIVKSGTQSNEFTSISALIRPNFYFVNEEKVAAYIGVGVGYRTGNWVYKSSDPNYREDADTPTVIPFGFEATIGTKVMFAPNIGAYAEFGMAKSIVQLGMCFSFAGNGEGGGMGGGGARW